MHNLPKEPSLLLAAFVIAAALRVLQKRFPKQDPWFVERLIISACAGLFLLITANKLLSAPALAPLSIPFAAAVFVVSIFHTGYSLNKISSRYRTVLLSASLAAVAFISYLTLGLPGSAVVIPALFVFPRSSIR